MIVRDAVLVPAEIAAYLGPVIDRALRSMLYRDGGLPPAPVLTVASEIVELGQAHRIHATAQHAARLAGPDRIGPSGPAEIGLCGTLGLVSITEAARLTGRHPRVLRRLALAGRIRSERALGDGRGSWLVDPLDVLETMTRRDSTRGQN